MLVEQQRKLEHCVPVLQWLLRRVAEKRLRETCVLLELAESKLVALAHRGLCVLLLRAFVTERTHLA